LAVGRATLEKIGSLSGKQAKHPEKMGRLTLAGLPSARKNEFHS
jgi:hypothetical protein